MKNLIKSCLFILLSCNLSAQSKWSEEMVLWKCSNEPNLKLMYRVNIGEGGRNSFVEIIVPNNIGESRISGILHVEENKGIDNNGITVSKNEYVEIDKNSMDKEYTFNISKISQLSFEGTCVFSNSNIKVNSEIAEKYVFDGNDKDNQELTDIQTKKILDLFFGVNASKDLIINSQDKNQAKILLKELIIKSCEMGVATSLIDLDASLLSVIKVIYSSNSNCKDALKKGKYYESVRKTIANNFSSNFQIRKQTGEW